MGERRRRGISAALRTRPAAGPRGNSSLAGDERRKPNAAASGPSREGVEAGAAFANFSGLCPVWNRECDSGLRLWRRPFFLPLIRDGGRPSDS